MAPLLAVALLAQVPGLGPPARFTGFSGDSRLFAYASPSSGAGVPVLRVVRCDTGAVVHSFALADPARVADAENYLRDFRFDRHPRPAPPELDRGFVLSARIEDGAAVVALARRDGGGRRVLHRTVLAGGRVHEVSLWGFSPSGTCAAFHESWRGPTEYGRGEDYFVVDVARGERALSRPSRSAGRSRSPST